MRAAASACSFVIGGSSEARCRPYSAGVMVSSMHSILNLATSLRRLADDLEAFEQERREATPVAPQQQRRLLSYAEAADYLSVSRRTVTSLATAGELPRVNIGHRVLFDVTDLDAYVQRLKE